MISIMFSIILLSYCKSIVGSYRAVKKLLTILVHIFVLPVEADPTTEIFIEAVLLYAMSPIKFNHINLTKYNKPVFFI
jgi:hypothetical protein